MVVVVVMAVFLHVRWLLVGRCVVQTAARTKDDEVDKRAGRRQEEGEGGEE